MQFTTPHDTSDANHRWWDSIRQKPFMTWFMMTLGLAWSAALLMLILPYMPLALIAALAPTIAVFVLNAVTGKSQEASSRDLLPWRMGVQWHVIILPAVLIRLITLMLDMLAPDSKADYSLLNVLVFTLALAYALGISETFAWQGAVFLREKSRLLRFVVMAVIYLPLYFVPAFLPITRPAFIVLLPFFGAMLVLYILVWHRLFPINPVKGIWWMILRHVRRMLLGVVLITVAMLTTAALYENIIAPSEMSKISAPGQMIDIGGYSLHLNCMGKGSPTIILEAGSTDWSVGWSRIQPILAKSTRVCAYDRAGIGWSDPRPTNHHDAVQVATELHTLLNNAGIEPPYVLAGHSMGGVYIRVFAGQYPDEVVGMALIDPTNPDAVDFSGMTREEAQAQIELPNSVLWVAAHFGILRPYAQGARLGLPDEAVQIVTAFWASTKTMNNARGEWGSLLTMFDQVHAAGTFGAIPLAVVLADHESELVNVPQEVRERLDRANQILVALSTNSLFRVIPGTNHGSIMWEAQYAAQTAATIQQVLDAARNGTPLAE